MKKEKKELEINEGVVAKFISGRVAKRMIKDLSKKSGGDLSRYDIKKSVDKAMEEFERDIKKIPKDHLRALFGL